MSQSWKNRKQQQTFWPNHSRNIVITVLFIAGVLLSLVLVFF